MGIEEFSKELSATHLDAMRVFAARFFESDLALGGVEPVASSDLPEPYRQLLSHAGHMTEALEAWHASPVVVQVEAVASDDHTYARHSLLRRAADDRVVQSGIMRVARCGLSDELDKAIEAGDVPLGRLLVESRLLRQVELLALWQIVAGSQLARELEIARGEVVYGRSARILVEGKRVVELLEIVRA